MFLRGESQRKEKSVTEYERGRVWNGSETEHAGFDYDRDVVIPCGTSVGCDPLIRQFGAGSLSREYDMVDEIPGPDMFVEDAVFVPVGSNSHMPHVPGI
jgi:hypothetical protein